MQIHRHAYGPLLGIFLCCCSITFAQEDDKAAVKRFINSNALEYKIRAGSQRVTMYANSSKILTLENKQIPRALVQNPEVVNAIAISPNQIQLSGLKPGVTEINLWDENEDLYTIELVVYGNAKELELLLETEFPNSSLRVRPLATSVVLSGWVDGPEVIERVIRMAEDYYPKVINNIRVGDNQQVQLHVQVMEVSRTKLRQLGVDWAAFGASDFIAQGVSGLIQETTSNAGAVAGTGSSTVTFGLTGGNSSFFGVLDALRQYDLVKVLAEPTLTTVSGRPAAFNAGGEFPILIPQGLGTVAVEYKRFGTRVDFVPIVLGNGNIRLEVRPQVSEIDNARGVDIDGFRVPGLRNRWVDTAVEMRAGQTLALAGLIQDRVESQNRGVPFLADLPWAGTMFRRVVQSSNEIELLVLVRPEYADAMDRHEVPMFGPGEHTEVPSDKELYMRGYMEVPNCCPDGSCLKCRAGRGQFAAPIGTMDIQGTPYHQGSPVQAEPSGVIMPSQESSPIPVDNGIPLPSAQNGKPSDSMSFGMRAPAKAGPKGSDRQPSGKPTRRTASKSRWGR